MKADPTEAPRRRDYDRRKKRAPIKKIGRPFWRQPLLLGLIVLLLGSGGPAAGGRGARAGWSRRAIGWTRSALPSLAP